jgi:aminodeoxyfutalosine synthase
MLIEDRIKKSNLIDIYEKVRAEKSLSFADGVKLYNSHDLLSLGFLANIARERKNGNRAYFIRNQHINYTNICVNRCKFCAFSKDRGDPGAYEMTVEEIGEKVRENLSQPVSEVHIVGGLNPKFPYSYYLEMLRTIKKIRPLIHIQAFTAVEIAFIAEMGKKSIEDTLNDLKGAGLGSLPGGGAEVFSPRIRQELCPKKLDPESWIEVAKTAHRMGIPGNATMLYGHLETKDELVEHLIKLREAQAESRGFLAFIPLAFHPQNTGLDHLPATTGFDDLKNLAISRLILDNFPHIKAFWIMITPKVSQVSLAFGVDDIDGTVTEEKITHSAGAATPQSLTLKELVGMIKKAGKQPVERDTLYNVVREY